ncbi:hypothetical protein BRADI_1g64127v3 [Brachypodium distachyon]|uniref:Uncharacterized protein n=1 Tax=Brachypodium distachyon TaxID=15368 RepID=A0A2K2DTC2_BRADI|nr:hypothetical protein BRADI_1g64127v3 [Brachypodium distachyon]
MSVPVTTASSASFFFLKALFCIPITTHHEQLSCLRAKVQIRFFGSSNGDCFVHRSLLGGVAFGALIWRRWICYNEPGNGLAKDSDFEWHDHADARAVPVETISSLLRSPEKASSA